ncbi:23S rRNA (adenine(1618)-N(6))-methyltransferase RlmF [Flavobacteriaceae bacterium F08102]|nr:23S rRNA (adenine(1618)-N(6))-methyltransferase RlmF [Flavobacteriaceae bacterium F08102]
MHSSNFHQDSYNFSILIRAYPRLAEFIVHSKENHKTIDFHNPNAVFALNLALLKHYYHIKKWEIPPGYLCPPIPGRVDYLHYVADILKEFGGIEQCKGLDIGTGANFIYPLLGAQVYQWQMVGTDIDRVAYENALVNKRHNPQLSEKLSVHFQSNPSNIFKGIIKSNEKFDFTMCNPPFHSSAEMAAKASQRKLSNLNQAITSKLNFGGMPHELWCNGGELLFIKRIIKESVQFGVHVKFFTSLVSLAITIPPLIKLLQKRGASYRIVHMAQGSKKSRLLVWSFSEKLAEK